jgi:hypothetical protein
MCVSINLNDLYSNGTGINLVNKHFWVLIKDTRQLNIWELR